jgi:shikimate dehydrogenase
VLALVDDVHASALTAGAANTLVRSPSGRVVAHNTDVAAIGEALVDLGAQAGGAIVVLGSGGAARAAVAAAVTHLGATRVIVRARAFSDPARARDFAAGMAAGTGDAELVLEPLAAGAPTQRAVTCILQATSAGMHGGSPGDDVARCAPFAALVDGGVALDLVYTPPVTPFLAAASERGIRHADGLGVLVRQGALAFELWLGVPAPLHEMRAAVSGSGG